MTGPLLFCPKRMFRGLFVPDWLGEMTIPWSAKAVYAAAAGKSDAEWVEFTHTEMAGRLGMDASTVKRSVAALVDAGLIVKERTGEARITGGSNRYAFVWRDEFGASLRRGQIAPSGEVTTGGADRPVRGGQDEPPAGGTLPPPLQEEVEEGLRENHRTPATAGAEAAPRLCQLLAKHAEQQTLQPTRVTKKWLDAARLMVDRDGLTPEQIERAIAWVSADSFWAANVLSMPTLRAKWGTLVAHARRDAARGVNTAQAREARRADLRAWAEQGDAA
ncbi:MAG: hypothetical protein AB7G65_19870 [Thermoleophilia bacterium]